MYGVRCWVIYTKLLASSLKMSDFQYHLAISEHFGLVGIKLCSMREMPRVRNGSLAQVMSDVSSNSQQSIYSVLSPFVTGGYG